MDDHQLQLLHQFDEMQLIEPCYDIENLQLAYENLKKTEYKHYVSNTKAVIGAIDRIIDEDINSTRNKNIRDSKRHLFLKKKA